MAFLSASPAATRPLAALGTRAAAPAFRAAAVLPPLAAPALRRSYHEAVHDHFNRPRNVGQLDKADPDVGTAFVGKAACGDVIKLQVKAANGVITEAKFKTFGCGSAIASSSLATEMIIGRPVDEALEVRNKDIASHLKLPPVKIHCSVLAQEAIQAAIADWKLKQAAKGGQGGDKKEQPGNQQHPGKDKPADPKDLLDEPNEESQQNKKPPPQPEAQHVEQPGGYAG